jgi:hypothetical protein
MDAHDDYLDRIHRGAGPRWSGLLHHFNEQCEPSMPSVLRPLRTGRVPDDEWERSPEFRAIATMLAHCWPSQRCQRQ